MLQYAPEADLIAVEDGLVVTRRLADALTEARMSGFHLEPIELEWEEGVWDHDPEEPLPDWVRLVPDGYCEYNRRGDVLEHSGDDLCFGSLRVSERKDSTKHPFLSDELGLPSSLVVSEKCLDLLLRFKHPELAVGWLRSANPAEVVSTWPWEQWCGAENGERPELFQVDPEWRGRLGPNTVFGVQGKQWEPQHHWRPIAHLHWVPDDCGPSLFWRCDAAFMVDVQLAVALQEVGMTGFSLGTLEVARPTGQACCRLVPEGHVTFDNVGGLEEWTGHDLCWGDRTRWVSDDADLEDPRGWEPLCGPYGLFVTRRCLMLLLKHELGGLHARAHGWR